MERTGRIKNFRFSLADLHIQITFLCLLLLGTGVERKDFQISRDFFIIKMLSHRLLRGAQMLSHRLLRGAQMLSHRLLRGAQMLSHRLLRGEQMLSHRLLRGAQIPGD